MRQKYSWLLVAMVFTMTVQPFFVSADTDVPQKEIPAATPAVETGTSSTIAITTATTKVPETQNTVVIENADYVPGEVLVKYKESKIDLDSAAGEVKAEEFALAQALEVSDTVPRENIALLSITDDTTVEETIAALEQNSNVEYAEPNYKRYSSAIATNDTYRGVLWGLDNTGQTIDGSSSSGSIVTGVSDADIDAPEAWAITDTASSTSPVIVAIIDIGVAYNHPDLFGNMWDGSNCKSETGSILGNCLYGYDFENDDINPLPTDGVHGTHIAGTIAAIKNNNKGIIGVAPQAKIMALRFDLTTLTEVKAIDFAIQNGAKVINASFTGSDFSQFEYDAISRFREAGGIFVTAPGNAGMNNDVIKSYPADYDFDNIISVAATNQRDLLASFSNYGATSVDVAAPGVNIYSTVPSKSSTNVYSDGSDEKYDYLSGTSMAVPHVVGLAALIWGYNNTLSAAEVKNIILTSGDSLPSLSDKTVSGKRINAAKALQMTPLPPDVTAPVVTLNGSSTVSLTVGTTYTELGAKAFDARDGVLPVVVTGSVATSTTGTYIVSYSATDAASNTATTTRTIQVVPVVVPDTTAPTITLNGLNQIQLTVGSTYIEQGATANDSIDGNLTSSIVTTGSVISSTVGTYVITYTVADIAGNQASTTRTVSVVAPVSGGGGGGGSSSSGGGGGGGSKKSTPKIVPKPAPVSAVLGASTSTPTTNPLANLSQEELKVVLQQQLISLLVQLVTLLKEQMTSAQ